MILLLELVTLIGVCTGVLLNSNVNGNTNPESVSQLRQDVLALLASQNARIKTLEEKVEKQTKESGDVHGGVAFMAELDQSVQASGTGYIGFNNVVTNVGGAFSTPQFVVPTNATYYLRFQATSIAQTPSIEMWVRLTRNGMVVEGTTISTSVSGNTTITTLGGTFLLTLVRNDVIRVDITKNTGSSYIVGGDLSTHFMGFMIH